MVAGDNSSGSYRVTLEKQMRDFDSLPPAARLALSNARLDFATPPLLKEWKKGTRRCAAALAEEIEAMDEAMSKAELRKVWGPDYPGACQRPAKRRR